MKLQRAAFTLPEMLVVLGIIAILIAILLPVLHKARELANQATCMSHLRQIGQATLQYGVDNEGEFPGNGNGAGNGGPTSPEVVPYDWVYWDTTEQVPLNDVTQSPIAKYLNVKDAAIFICPSDSLARVLPYNIAHPGESAYPYSYSFNTFLGNGPDYHPSRNQKLGQVNRAPMVIMFVCEDERTVNDGSWLPYPTSRGLDTLASRHDGQKDLTDTTARGNVIFCDGHGEFITRAVAEEPSSYQPLYPTMLNN